MHELHAFLICINRTFLALIASTFLTPISHAFLVFAARAFLTSTLGLHPHGITVVLARSRLTGQAFPLRVTILRDGLWKSDALSEPKQRK